MVNISTNGLLKIFKNYFTNFWWGTWTWYLPNGFRKATGCISGDKKYITFSQPKFSKNAYYLYSARSNPTYVVLVIVLSIIDNGAWYWDRQSWSVCNHSSNHSDNIGGIRTRAVEIVSIFKMELSWVKDKLHFEMLINI